MNGPADVNGPAEIVDALVAGPSPEVMLFGVRHHSPACARAIVAAAEEWRPEAIAIEMPAELAPMLPWVADPGTVAPVAIAVGGGAGPGLYPFADFSPELAILRWAHREGVDVHCIDLPAGAVIGEGGNDEQGNGEGDGGRTAGDGAGDGEGSEATAIVDTADLIDQEAWDTRVEARSVGAQWRRVRRAALAVGVGARLAETRVDARTRAREANMRACLEDLRGRRVMAVVGSFHCLALMDGEPARPAEVADAPVSLVPYGFAELDSRSGYASGIRDPRWQQGIVEASGSGDVEKLATRVITEVAREMRKGGEPAGTGEVVEAVRIAGDLARLRGIPAPGRREVMEALTSVFAHGSVIGRGRTVARALQKVMIGDRRGKLVDGAPEPALEVHARELLASVGLPASPTDGVVRRRIDPFKGGRDLRRHVALARLAVLDVPYEKERTSGQVRGLETRGYTVTCEYRSSTAGALGVCTAGATLEQAAANTLNRRVAGWAGDPDVLLGVAGDAAAAALPEPLGRALEKIAADVAPRAGFATALRASEMLVGMGGGREPAATLLPQRLVDRAAEVAESLSDAVVREMPGVAGSDDDADAALLAGVAGLLPDHRVRAMASLEQMSRSGSDLMRGAATAVLAMYGEHEPTGAPGESVASGEPDDAGMDAEESGMDAESSDEVSALLGSWVDGAMAAPGPARSLTGFLLASRGTWADGELLDGVEERVESMPDASFVAALPRLRGAFDPVAPAERERFLDHVARRVGKAAPQAASPATLAANAEADAAAAARLRALGLRDMSFTPAMRWRLVLGAEPDALAGKAAAMAGALDELYGDPRSDPSGESDGRIGAGGGTGQVSARQWAEDIEALFGGEHVHEIAGRAAERGRADMVEHLRPDDVRPSVELLTTMLNLRGALPEARLRKIRPIIAKVIAELSAALARDLAPALRGAASSVPSRRSSPELDVPATIRRNLRHVVDVDGTPRVVPVTPYFRTPEKRISPWHIIVLVDVSGSMEASTVYAAMTAAILAGVPTYRISFVTFDTAIADLSDHVEDPLQLLLEISVGGGTDIASAVAYAATLVKVPNRTALILISDFEEGGNVGGLLHQVGALADSGVHLIGCAALDDSGNAVYNVGIAEAVAAAGMRVASLSPLQLARWVGQVLA
ncbi:VWA domain containing CoxE-like protein [Corynebacterium hansenii]|nr:VWA domain containing CoxE-like protein [Corynebacterium hansenii]